MCVDTRGVEHLWCDHAGQRPSQHLASLTEGGGNLEVIKDGVNGLVAEPYDQAESFAGAIIDLLRDPAKRLEMGMRNRAAAEKTSELEEKREPESRPQC